MPTRRSAALRSVAEEPVALARRAERLAVDRSFDSRAPHRASTAPRRSRCGFSRRPGRACSAPIPRRRRPDLVAARADRRGDDRAHPFRSPPRARSSPRASPRGRRRRSPASPAWATPRAGACASTSPTTGQSAPSPTSVGPGLAGHQGVDAGKRVVGASRAAAPRRPPSRARRRTREPVRRRRGRRVGRRALPPPVGGSRSRGPDRHRRGDRDRGTTRGPARRRRSVT